jgi:hypothetical protein
MPRVQRCGIRFAMSVQVKVGSPVVHAIDA